MTRKLTDAEKQANIKRTGLPNPDYKMSSHLWIITLIGIIIIFAGTVYFSVSAHKDKAFNRASSPHTTQAGEWMRNVSVLPETPERKVFISELGIALADGVISDEEHANLSADYEALNQNR